MEIYVASLNKWEDADEFMKKAGKQCRKLNKRQRVQHMRKLVCCNEAVVKALMKK